MAELNDKDRARLERLRALRKGGMDPEFKLSQQLTIGDPVTERAAERLVNPPDELREAVAAAIFEEPVRETSSSDYAPPKPSVSKIPIDEEPETGGEPETEGALTTPSIWLPPPSDIVSVELSTARNTRRDGRPYSRPDYPQADAYGQGPQFSTRVKYMQWVPTTITSKLITPEQAEDLYGQASFFKDYELTESAVFGDILVMFVRPSKSQKYGFGPLYIYEHCAESVWRALSSAVSLGKYVGSYLPTGRPCQKGDGERHKDIHSKITEPDGSPRDMRRIEFLNDPVEFTPEP